jgi:LemA protein
MKKYTGLLIAAAVILVLGSWVVGSYNTLVNAEVNLEKGWSNVNVQLQRRFDLIPQLVNTVKGNANFEQETLTQVIEARSNWAQANQSGDVTEQIAAANQTQSALSRLLVTVESYPELKANQAFQNLMVSLEGTENRIGVSRSDYNQVAAEYNILVRRFPTVIFANIFGYDKAELFQADTGAETAPEVNFE